MIKFWRHPFVWMCLKWHNYCPKHLRARNVGFASWRYCDECIRIWSNKRSLQNAQRDAKRRACIKRAQSLQKKA